MQHTYELNYGTHDVSAVSDGLLAEEPINSHSEPVAPADRSTSHEPCGKCSGEY